MRGDVDKARAAAVQAFLAVRRLARRTRALERAAGAEVTGLAGLATTMDTLAYQAEAAVRGHAGCLVAAELAAADPVMYEVATTLARAAENWASILETVATVAVHVNGRALDAVALAPYEEGRARDRARDPSATPLPDRLKSRQPLAPAAGGTAGVDGAKPAPVPVARPA